MAEGSRSRLPWCPCFNLSARSEDRGTGGTDHGHHQVKTRACHITPINTCGRVSTAWGFLDIQGGSTAKPSTGRNRVANATARGEQETPMPEVQHVSGRHVGRPVMLGGCPT